jgi:hypothetical protein
MAHPPPIIVLVDGEGVLLAKGTRIRAVGRFSGTDVLAAWIHAARSAPTVAQRIGTVLHEATSDAPGTEAPAQPQMPLIPLGGT